MGWILVVGRRECQGMRKRQSFERGIRVDTLIKPVFDTRAPAFFVLTIDTVQVQANASDARALDSTSQMSLSTSFTSCAREIQMVSGGYFDDKYFQRLLQ